MHLATITQPAELDIEMRVKNGRGYIQAERNRDTDLEVGYIPLDSDAFSGPEGQLQGGARRGWARTRTSTSS